MTKAKDLRQLFQDFIDECEFSRRLRPATLRGYKSVFLLFLSVMPEVNHLKSIEQARITDFFKRIETRQRKVGRNTITSGVKNSTIKTHWNKLNAFFEWLAKNNHIERNPLTAIKPPEPRYEDTQALENSDVQKILTAIQLHSYNSYLLKRDMLIVCLLLFCGLRKGELLALQIPDIDFENNLLRVRGETSKSKKIRYLPIHNTLLMHLREYLVERNKRDYKTEYLLVSSTRDCKLTSDGLMHWVRKLKDVSGVNFHLHSFRHTFACNLAKKNIGLVKIQKLMGHADPKMTATYLRSITTEDLREDINILSFDD